MTSKYYTLKDLATIKYGKNQKDVASAEGAYPIYGTGGLMGYATKFLYNKPSVLIGRKGTIDKVRYIDSPFWTVDTLFYTEINTQKIIPKYLFYLMSTVDLNQYNEGTTIPSLRTETLNRLEFNIHDMNTQRKIVKVLSAIDDKIELNNKINANLEEQAQAIFKSWFVDTEYNIEKMTTLGDTCKCELGGTPSRAKTEYWNGNIAWINSGEVNKFRITQASEYITKLGLEKSATKLLPKKTTVLAITGATLGQVSLLEIDSCANQSVVGILENDILPYEFIYPFICSNIHEILSHQTGGAQQHINKQNIESLSLPLPTQELINNYKQIAKPIFEMIAKNCFENENLIQLRDTLLPKLMNGEINVEKIQP